MKLYECKRNSIVRLLEDQDGPPGSPSFKAGDIIKFHHIDGMYSYCHHKDYVTPIHLPAWTEVEYVD